jgi:DNA-binding Lrp family transcriptional regulator
MPPYELDDLDRYILHALQRDARHVSSGDIAEAMGVSASTVRKRIQRLEEEEVVRGYSADIDYERAGYPLRMLLVCTAPILDREDLGVQAADVEGVVSVTEVASGQDNLLVYAVATDSDDVTRIAQTLSEAGLAVSEEELLRSVTSVPFRAFGDVDEDSDGDDGGE